MELIQTLAKRYDLGMPQTIKKTTHNSGSDVYIVDDAYVVKLFPEATDSSIPAKEASLCLALEKYMPTPHVIGYGGSDESITRPYIVQSKAAGEALESAWESLSSEAKSHLCGQLGTYLATTHRLHREDVTTPSADWNEPGVSVRLDRALEKISAQSLLSEEQVAAIRDYFELYAPNASEMRTGLRHGSYRFGNILVEGGEITAVLDWEDATFGDTQEELGLTLYRTIPEPFHDAFIDGYTHITPIPTGYEKSARLYALLFYLEYLPDIDSWIQFPGKQAYYRRETERVLHDTIGESTHSLEPSLQ